MTDYNKYYDLIKTYWQDPYVIRKARERRREAWQKRVDLEVKRLLQTMHEEQEKVM